MTVEVPNGEFSMALFEDQLKKSLSDVLTIIRERKLKGFPAKKVSSLCKIYMHGLNGLSDACIALQQDHEFVTKGTSAISRFHEFSLLSKALHGHFMMMYSGRLSFRNKYCFAPRLSVFMRRALFIPEALIPNTHRILLGRAGGAKFVKRVWEELKIDEASFTVKEEFGKGHCLKHLQYPDSYTKDWRDRQDPFVCRHCMKMFVTNNDLERFKFHQCVVTSRDRTDLIPIEAKEYQDYREARMKKRTPDQIELHSLVVVQKKSVIVLGDAGSGKSFAADDIIRSIIQHRGAHAVVVVSHGQKVAENIHGITVNKCFRLGVLEYNAVYQYIHTRGNDRIKAVEEFVNKYFKGEGNQMYMERLISAVFLIWDEFSQISLDLYEFLDLVCQKVRGNKKPFGGLVRVFFGDPCQSRPWLSQGVKKQIEAVQKSVYEDYDDYLFQSKTLAKSDYVWHLFDSSTNKRMEQCRRLYEFNTRVKLSQGTEDDLKYMKDINQKGKEKVTDYYINFVAMANMIAHIRSDFVVYRNKQKKEIDAEKTKSEQDKVIQMLLSQTEETPISSYKEFLEHVEQTPLKREDKVEGPYLKLDRIKSMFEMALSTLTDTEKGLNYFRTSAPDHFVNVIVTENCQVDAFAELQKLLNEGKSALHKSKVDDTVYILDHESGRKLELDPNSSNKVLRNSFVRELIKEESAGKLLDDLNVYRNQQYILTSNSAGACLSSHDVVSPTEMTKDGQIVVNVSNMPPRNIAMTDCVEITISYEQLPNGFLKDFRKGQSILIKRRQYPLVPSTCLTTVRSAGLTLNGPAINDNTRTMKQGDGHLMSSRKTTDEDMYFMHIPKTVKELNAFDFKCPPAARTLVNHLKEVHKATKSNILIGNFYVTHNGRNIERVTKGISIGGQHNY